MASELPDGGTVLLDVQDEAYFGLNSVGTLIWREIQAGAPVAAIRSTVVAEFGISAELAIVDVADLIEQMLGRGLIQESNRK